MRVDLDLLGAVEAQLLKLVKDRLSDHGRPLYEDGKEHGFVTAWRGVRALRNEERPGQAVEAYFNEVLRPILSPMVEGESHAVEETLNQIGLFLLLTADDPSGDQ